MSKTTTHRRPPGNFFQVPPQVQYIGKVLAKDGKRCYVVGGCLRNAIMELDPVDIDLATDALPQEVMDLFGKGEAGIKVVPTGIKFGTVMVVMDGTGYEITTLRGEGNYLDGRRPEVVNFTDDIHGDLSRRDFTMNALALDCHTNEIIDDFDSIADIRSGVLRAVGDPMERFREDGLRVMRAFRFMRYGRPDPALEVAIDRCRDMLLKISQERITVEFMKILEASNAREILESMMEHGIFDIIAPELPPATEVFDPLHDMNVWQHTMDVISRMESMGMENMEEQPGMDRETGIDGMSGMDGEPDIDGMPGMEEPSRMEYPDAELRLAALLHDIGKVHPVRSQEHELTGEEIAGKILQRFKCSNKLVSSTKFLVKHHMDTVKLKDASLEKLRIFKYEMGAHLDALLRLSRANHAGLPGGPDAEDNFGRRLEEATLDANASPFISGRVIMKEFGLKQGRKVGEIKEELFRIQLAGDIRSKDRMMEILRSYEIK